MRKRKMGIRARLVLTMASIIAVFFAIGIPYFSVEQGEMKDNLLEEKAAYMKMIAKDALAAKEQVWLTNALQLASNPIIQEAMHSGDRERCIQILNQYNQLYKKHTAFKRVSVLLVDRDLKVFVKSWDAQDHGEKLSYSDGLKYVRETGKPVVTLEAAKKGLRLKGLFPIEYQNELVGVVDFEGGLNSIRRAILPHEIFFLYFLINEDLPVATDIQGMQELGNYTLSIKEIDQDFMDYAARSLNLEKALSGYVFDEEYLTVAVRAEQFDGKEKGLFLLGQKATVVTKDLDIQQKMINRGFFFAVLAMFAMIAALYWSINKNVMHRLGAEPDTLSEIVDQVALGESQIVFQENKGGNRGIYAAMQKMVQALSEKAGLAERVADGDLSCKVQLASDRDQLGKSLTKMVKNLARIVKDVRTAAAQVHSGANQVSESSQSLSQGATESAASLEEISASMSEISGQVRRNAESAQQANQLTLQAKTSAQEGNQNMQQLAAAMGDIKASSGQIGVIIKTIDEIAFQTNLLALNAAVEAARAGKHGKGFAVVAQEVRALAQRSARAARETTELIDSSNKKVENGAEIASQTETSLTEIVDNITRAADIVAEIASASDEQARGLQQVNQGLGQIDSVTQQNTANAEESASASEELTGQARQLQELLEQFTLADSTGLDRKAATVRPQSRALLAAPAAPKGWGAPAVAAGGRAAEQKPPEPGAKVMIQWSPEFSVSIEKMDNQHRRLVDLINQLYSSLSAGKAQEALSSILTELVEYTQTHFTAEEALMRVNRYPELEKQQQMHSHFVARITDMRDRFEKGSSLGVETMSFLKGWLLHHIQQEDRKYGDYLNQRGIS